MFFSQKNNLNIEKIKVKFSQIFLTLISTLKEENKIVLTKMAPGYGIRVNGPADIYMSSKDINLKDYAWSTGKT